MQTINITPTWAEVLPLLLTAVRDAGIEGRKAAHSELIRMAQAADRWNAAAPDMLRTLEFIAADANADLDAEAALLVQDAITKARG